VPLSRAKKDVLGWQMLVKTGLCMGLMCRICLTMALKKNLLLNQATHRRV